ncbi:MarR family transcriptional regulator [Spongiibacter sp. KMU-158]|uniref:MarR family transcriptional regulator n=1 Tax=Spongiibacter pelagi TaxID=2760804 RepID=A0A927BZD5_9GAMM|nr:MarR family transcriptional regulator [Spongiibacter pelagi]MBD2857844.1 MarR family transcriptional regulator [Spongiibacter pelagi]
MPIKPAPSNTNTLNQLDQSWQRYRNNPLRHLGEMTAYVEKLSMNTLVRQGYENLAMSYSAPLTLLSQGALRLTDLAAQLGISKQLCLQALKPIKKAAYIEERPDPHDGRAKQIHLSAKGQTMIAAAGEELMTINRMLSDILGDKPMADFTMSLRKLAVHYHLPSANNENHPALNIPSMMFGMLNRHFHRRLTEILAQQGYLNLQLSYAQVLVLIDNDGTPMQQMAEYNGVSLQAISRIAGELKQRGYIERRTSTDDRRSKRLFFTKEGQALIVASVSAMNTLEDELRRIIGKAAFTRWEKQLLKLSQQLVAPSKIEHGGGPASENQTVSQQRLLTYFAAQLSAQAVEGKYAEARNMIEQRLGKSDAQKLYSLLCKLRT